MYTFLAIFIGGGIGSLARYLICTKVENHWGTMLVNVLGAFFIGCAYGYFSQHLYHNPHIKMFIMTGLLGGFTTFSTYLLNFSTLISAHNYMEAFSYLILSVIIGRIVLVAGIKLALNFA